MSDNAIIALLGAVTVFLGVGWYTSYRTAQTMSRIHLAHIKGMHYSITGRDIDEDGEDGHECSGGES